MQPSQFHERKFSRTRPHTRESKLNEDLRGPSPALEASGKNYNSLFLIKQGAKVSPGND